MGRKKIITIFILLFIAIVAIYALPFKSSKYETIRDLIYLIFPAIAAISGFSTISTLNVKTDSGKSFLFLSLGLACWLIGDTIFFVFEHILNINPYPSVADAFYIAGYPLLFLGVTREMFLTDPHFLKRKSILYIIPFAILATGLFFLIYTLKFTQSSFLENTVAISYALDDVILAIASFIVLRIAFIFKGAKLFRPWFYIFIGIIFTLIADVLFAIYSTQYDAGIWLYRNIDLVFILSYLFFAYGILEARFFVEEFRKYYSFKTQSLDKKA